MNWKQIIRAAFDLIDEEWDQAVKLRALSEAERELLMTALGPPQKPTAKKSSATARVYERCVQCGKTKGHSFHKDSSNDGYHLFQPPPQPIKTAGKKSQRAQSLGDAIQRRPRGVVTGDESERCIYEIDDNGGLMECGEAADHNSHHKRTDPNYHPFTPAAQSAEPPSDQASSEIGKGAAGDAHHVASSGD